MLRGFWAKAKKAIIPVIPMLVLSLWLCPVVYAAGQVVDASLGASNEGVNHPFARNSFYAAGRHWAFFVSENGPTTEGFYSSSTDGVTWETRASVGASCLGEDLAIWYDGTNVHYARTDSGNDDYPVFYRRGVPNSDGTITWAAGEQTVIAGAGAATYYWGVSVATNSTGCPYVAFTSYGADSTYNVKISCSSTNTGSWSAGGGFPVTVDDPIADNSTYCSITPLSDSMMYFTYVMPTYAGGDDLYGYLYEHAIFINATVVMDSLDTTKTNYYSIVADSSDNLHMLYRIDGPLGADRIEYAVRDWTLGAWAAGAESVYGGGTGEQDDARPVLGIDEDSNLVAVISEEAGLARILYKQAPIAAPDGFWNDEAAVVVDDVNCANRITCAYSSASPFGIIWNDAITVFYDYFPYPTSDSSNIPTGLVLFMDILPLVFVALGIALGIYFIQQGQMVQGIVILAVCCIVIAVGSGIIIDAIPR